MSLILINGTRFYPTPVDPSWKEVFPTMLRKFALFVSVLAVLSMAVVVSAGDSGLPGCYLISSDAVVQEGDSFTVTVTCNDLNNVYGFQFGTDLVSDHATAADPYVYTPGTFNVINGDSLTNESVIITGLENEPSLAMYAVSRTGDDRISGEVVTLGSYVINTSKTVVVPGNSDATIDFIDNTFKLSDYLSNPINGMLQSNPEVVVTIHNLDLAWLSGDLRLQSEVDNITALSNARMDLGSYHYDNAVPVNGSPNAVTFTVSSANEYGEAGQPDADGTLEITVKADMYGHLECQSVVDLDDNAASKPASTVIGSTGTVTLRAGDANNDGHITNADATVIGFDFGHITGEINTATNVEANINQDDIVDIYDLVHVGRNFEVVLNASAPACQ